MGCGVVDELSVAIVDDEQIIREGLRRVVPWERHGFRVVADFPSAEQALSYQRSHPIDLLIVDVCMPVTDGLSLIRRLRNERPTVHFVILSGHQSFDYAREAIDLGVLGYLLKPIRLEQMEAVLVRARSTILEERNPSTIGVPTMTAAESIGESIEQGRSVSWNDDRWNEVAEWLRNAPATAVLVDFLPVIAPETGSPVHLDSYDTVLGTIRRVLGSADETFVAIPLYARGGVLFFLRSSSAIRHVGHLIERVCVPNGSGTTPTWTAAEVPVAGAPVDTALIARLEGVLEARWWEGLRHIYDTVVRQRHPACREGATEVVMGYIPRYAQRLSHAIEAGNGHAAEEVIKEILSAVDAHAITDRSELSGIVIALFGLVGRELADDGVDAASLQLDRMRDIARQIAGHTFLTLRQQLGSVVAEAARRCAEREQRPHNRTINAALYEIERRYMENIGLVEIADTVGVTPSHLSRLFRNVLGRSFREYLTETRIAEAKRRLRSSTDRVYEIAAVVGFREQRYFSEVFRKSTGMTPLQYRNERSGSHIGSPL